MRPIFSLLLLALSTSVASAAEPVPIFDPTSFSFTASTHRSSLNVYNNDDFTIQWTAKVVEWDQDEKGVDRYTDTDDITVMPQTVTLRGHSGEVMEIASKQFHQGKQEHNYRIIMTSSVLTSGRVGVTYHYGMPIFIPPTEPLFSPSIEILPQPTGQILLTVNNDGSAHSYLESLEITGQTKTGENIFTTSKAGWYVLGHRKRAYLFELSRTDCQRTTKLTAVAHFRDATDVTRTEPLQFDCSYDRPTTGFENADSQITAVKPQLN